METNLVIIIYSIHAVFFMAWFVCRRLKIDVLGWLIFLMEQHRWSVHIVVPGMMLLGVFFLSTLPFFITFILFIMIGNCLFDLIPRLFNWVKSKTIRCLVIS